MNVKENIAAIVELIASGDHAGAAKHFVGLALGPGAWDEIPPEYQQIVIHNAPTFLDETNDPQQLEFDIEGFKRFTKPVLLTRGDQSPPMFAPVVAKLAAALPHADVMTLSGAGHIPHVTHPAAYMESLIQFVDSHGRA
jgi:pimeloyl-ACP methyl ester carboxylesterase